MTTLERLQALLVKHNQVTHGDLVPDASLEALGLDSMDTIDLLFNIEDEFNITVPRDQAPLKTLQDVVDYIDRLVSEQHVEPTVEERGP